MRHKLLFLITSAVFLPGLLASAQGSVFTLPEYSGSFHTASETYPLPAVTIGTFSYIIPVGQTVSSAVVSGAFGNSSVNSTALADFYLAGVRVASCSSFSDPCFSNDLFSPPVSWNYTFTGTQLSALNSGSAAFTVIQTGPFTVQSGQTTLTINFASASVPEPSTFGLLGISAAGVFLFFRKRKV